MNPQVPPNQFSTLAELQDYFHLWLPAPKMWRLVAKPVSGQINGLPTFRGMAVATNGIHVVLISSACVALVGHLGWFIKDQREAATDLYDDVAAKQTKPVNLEEMEEFFV